MRKLFASILLSIISHVCLSQNTFDFSFIKSLGLQVVNITTQNGEPPTCDYAEAPEGCMGYTCINQTKVPCRVVITMLNDTLYDSGEYEKSVSGATIKINGNTSSFQNNKPYKLKLQKKADLLIRNDDKYKDKNWRLLKDAYTLKTMIGLKVNELIGLPWTPRYRPCNVFLNGDYQGCYLIIESVERNSDCRLDVDKKTGYIVERDAYWWKEEHYFSTNYFEPYKGYRWTWKYPDEEDVTPEQENYIKNYINQAEESIKNGTYERYIDVMSFARWMLAHDIMGTWDSGGSNLYVMKYDNTENSLLQMANMWDFDTIFSVGEYKFSNYHNGDYDFYYPALFNSSNKTFIKAYQQLWNEIKPTLFEQLTDFINQYAASEEAKALQLSREQYTKRWNYELDSVDKNAQDAIAWFSTHLSFLDEAISQLNTETSIQNIHSDKDTNEQMYNLSGTKVNTPNRSKIIIKGHKKYIYK